MPRHPHPGLPGRALCPGTLGKARNAGTPSPIWHHTFVGKLVLNHLYTACFWVRVSYAAAVPLLRSIDSQPSTQGFITRTGEKGKERERGRKRERAQKIQSCLSLIPGPGVGPDGPGNLHFQVPTTWFRCHLGLNVCWSLQLAEHLLSVNVEQG